MKKIKIILTIFCLCFMDSRVEASAALMEGAQVLFRSMNRQARIVFPAKGPKSEDHLRVGLSQLTSRDMPFQCDEKALNEEGSPFKEYSNTHEARALDFMSALEGEEDIIWGFAGGSGCLEVVHGIERSQKSFDRPKTLIGYSDMTFLLSYWAKKRWPAFHAPVLGLTKVADPVSKVGLNADTTLDSIMDILQGKTKSLTHEFEVISAGSSDSQLYEAENGVAGGNLMLVTELMGTTLRIDGENRFIFVEDVESDPTYVLRKLKGLYRTGLFEKAKGLIVGDILPWKEEHQALTRDVLREFVEFTGFDLPVLYSTGFGHGSVNKVMPFNFATRIQLKGEGKADLTVDF